MTLVMSDVFRGNPPQFSQGVRNEAPPQGVNMNTYVYAMALGAGALTLSASGNAHAATSTIDTAATISAEEVAAAQQAWGEGIVEIGKVSTEGGDAVARAAEHIASFYAYDDDATILFKPTLAAEDQFRETSEEALSYFVGAQGTEDAGFALAPFTAVRWDNNGTVISESGDMAVAMGNYYFTGTDGTETKVEYSFAYEKDDAGDLKIVLHHSSLPYSAD